jgi:hypothetical protein
MADNAAKKVGRFVANEMLGVDDVKRAVSKAKKGDVKGALKSAGAAAFEIGTTATAIGKGGALAVKAASKTISKEAEKTTAKVADKVAQKVAENSPAPKLGKKGGEVKSVRTDPKSEITVRRDMKQSSQKGDPHLGDLENKNKISISKPKSATYTTRENSMKQRISVESRMTDKRNTDIESAASAAKSAARSTVEKSLAENKAKSIAQGIIAGKAIVKGTQKDHYVTDRKNSTRKVKGD